MRFATTPPLTNPCIPIVNSLWIKRSQKRDGTTNSRRNEENAFESESYKETAFFPCARISAQRFLAAFDIFALATADNGAVSRFTDVGPNLSSWSQFNRLPIFVSNFRCLFIAELPRLRRWHPDDAARVHEAGR